jgi:hypothetical protein
LRRLSREKADNGTVPKLQMFFIAICGFDKAKDKIEDLLSELDLPVKVHICDPLSESARVFSDESTVFESTHEREAAMRIAYDRGVQLEKRAPLGYGDCQAAVVFEHRCPNNSLPILWQESEDFLPLFPRY